MILKGSQRGNGADLAIHLMNGFDNERIEIAEVYGTVASDLFGAFAEFEAVAAGTKANMPQPEGTRVLNYCRRFKAAGFGCSTFSKVSPFTSDNLRGRHDVASAGRSAAAPAVGIWGMYPRWIFLFSLLALVPGCATVPVEQLQAYSEAYEEARGAGSLLYAEAIPAIQEANEGGSDTPTGVEPAAGPNLEGASESAQIRVPFVRTLGPAHYSRDACDLGRSGTIPQSIVARCNALATVTAYNEVLLKLAAGDPAVAVRSDLGQLAGGLGTLQGLLEENQALTTLLPAAAVVVGPLAAIVGEVQNLARAEAIREELGKGRPHVQVIIRALREDVPRLHEIQREAYVARLRDVVFEASDIWVEAARIAGRHQAPSASRNVSERTAIVARFDALLSELEEVEGPAAEGLGPRVGGPDAATYTDATSTGLREQLALLEEAVERYHVIAAEWHRYEEGLRLYDGMLVDITQTLASLGSTDITNFFAADGTAAHWLSSALAVREKARLIKDALRAEA